MSADLDIAILHLLREDPTLIGLVPGGVYRDYAPEAVVDAAANDPNQVFGIVVLQQATSHPSFCEPPLVESRYEVQFISPSTDPTVAQAASERSEALMREQLPGSPSPWAADLSVETVRIIERIAFVEPDGPIRWQHRGNLWEVWSQVLVPAEVTP